MGSGARPCNGSSRNPGAIIGLVVVTLLIFVAIFAPWIAPYDPIEQNLDVRTALPGPRASTCSAPTTSAATSFPA